MWIRIRIEKKVLCTHCVLNTFFFELDPIVYQYVNIQIHESNYWLLISKTNFKKWNIFEN